jgi:hypothetical protein
MKKIILPAIAIVVAALLLSTTACKSPELEITWFDLGGSGTYNSLDNTSTIKLFGTVQLNIPNVATKPMWGKIYAWEYMISEGPTIILYINSEISYEVLGDYTLDTSDENSYFLWLDIETVIPRTGDMYNGTNPDTVSLSLWIMDNNDNMYNVSAVGPFQLTRE